jgi:signal transduction histidine kinase
MPPERWGPRVPSRGRDLTVAACSWAVAVLLLVTVTVAGRSQPESIPDAPALGSGGWWAAATLITAQAVVLLWRRAHPRSTLVAVATAGPIAAGLGVGAGTGSTSVAVLVAAYSLVVGVRFSVAAPALAAATALVAVGELVVQTKADVGPGEAIATAVLQGLGTLAVPAAVATVVRSLRETRTALDERAQAMDREQAALVQVAVGRERTAMARELHDIAAHHLSGIAVMTGAIGRQIDTDPEGAKVAVQQVREQSTAMLRDMRSLVGLLREGPTDPAPSEVARQESLSGIAGLVEAARATGADVRLTVLDRVDGRSPGADVGPLAQLSAYRTVQEALANAARHAPGARCEVVVDARDPAAVLVTVENEAPAEQLPPMGPGGGFGLVGMRERAELTDARLAAGPTADGGWLVSLRLPTLDQVDRVDRVDDRSSREDDR